MTTTDVNPCLVLCGQELCTVPWCRHDEHDAYLPQRGTLGHKQSECYLMDRVCDSRLAASADDRLRGQFCLRL